MGTGQLKRLVADLTALRVRTHLGVVLRRESWAINRKRVPAGSTGRASRKVRARAGVQGTGPTIALYLFCT